MTDQIEALKQVPLFGGLGPRELDALARQLHERRFTAGSTVTKEGETGAGFFVIADGSATVTVGGEEKTKLGRGDYFGEIALIDDGVRSATITADSDLLCYGLTPWEFRPFVEEHPEVAWTLLQTIARRFREEQSHHHTH